MIQSLRYENQTHICKGCFNDFVDDSFHSLFENEVICDKCFKEYKPVFKEFRINGIKCLAIYFYEDKVKENIFIFKGCHDYELKDTFLYYFKLEIRLRYFNYYLVPMPSSKLDDEKRGFNHVVELFKVLNLPFLNVLKKTKKHKQSNLSFEERKSVINFLEVENGEKIEGKNILLVDDICTTGSTLKAAIKLISPYKPRKIQILVIAKREFTKEELSKMKKVDEII